MTQITAKFAGTCRSCGGRIRVGDKIEWSAGCGASHVTCPTKSPAAKSAAPVAPAPIKIIPPLGPIPAGLETEVIRVWWSDGEYLSGWMPSGSKPAIAWLETLKLAHYVSGWGNHVDSEVVKALVPGLRIADEGSFTIQQADDLARPGINAAIIAANDRRKASGDKRAAAFITAKSTGKPVVLRQWSEDCDHSDEECDVDNLTEYAMPDGTTKINRSHSY